MNSFCIAKATHIFSAKKYQCICHISRNFNVTLANNFVKFEQLGPSRYHFTSCDSCICIQEPASVAQLDAPSDWRPGGRGFNPRRGRQHSFVEIDHEIFSTVILSLPLIQEGQLSASGERMCTILVNRLED